MNHALCLHDMEVVDQGAAGFDGLGADAGAGGMNVLVFQVGDEPLQGPQKRFLC